jgi:glycosyltransferase involved in cell wall biosynthesis
MKVSIITVCLNSAETIEDAMKNVLGQTYKDIEYIVVDGGSTDGTIDIILRNKERISKFISGPDKGIYDAMNKGIRLSTGEIIAVLNSDDVYFDETVVGRMVEFIQNNNLDAAYGDLLYVDSKDTSRTTRFWKPGDYREGAFYYGWVIPHPTFFCRKRIFEKYGYFNENFQVAADFELMLRFIEKHQISVGYLPKLIVKMRTGGKANILRGMIRGNWEIMKSFRLNGLRLSPWFFIRKPIIKISQLFIKPDRLKSSAVASNSQSR